MFSTNLNEVNFAVGTIVTLTNDFRSTTKPLGKIQPLLKTGDEFEIIEIKITLAEDEQTELLDETIGATKLKHIKTGKVFDINDEYLDEKDNYWAFFTSFTPDMFNVIKKINQDS